MVFWKIWYIACSNPPILPAAAILWGCAVYLEKPDYPRYTTSFEKQSSECCQELLCSNDDYYEGLTEVGNPSSWSLVSDGMVPEKAGGRTETWKFSNRDHSYCLYRGFLGIEFPQYNKLTSISILCHMLWNCVSDTLAAAKESPGGWHCCGPGTLKASWWSEPLDPREVCIVQNTNFEPRFVYCMHVLKRIKHSNLWIRDAHIFFLLDVYLSLKLFSLWLSVLCGCLKNNCVSYPRAGHWMLPPVFFLFGCLPVLKCVNFLFNVLGESNGIRPTPREYFKPVLQSSWKSWFLYPKTWKLWWTHFKLPLQG